ncbi:MAG: tail fiber protein [Rhodanobacteraceae bacterium]|nr:tail fiber protein [Rhodanobacteraceae bacterium]
MKTHDHPVEGNIGDITIGRGVMPIVGEVRSFASDDIWFERELLRYGWLPCNGRSLSCATYRLLYKVIGARWGSRDPNLTFLLPDLEGYFLRGRVREPSDIDPDPRVSRNPLPPVNMRSVGSYQSDAMRGHGHGLGLQRYGGRIEYAEGAQTYMGTGVPIPATDSTSNPLGQGFGAETHPINAYVAFYIFAGTLTQQLEHTISLPEKACGDQEVEEIIHALSDGGNA